MTTSVGGNKEVVKQGENGFLIKYNDEFNLLEAIKTLYQDEDLRKQFIDAGKKTAQQFSVEKMCDQTEKLLNKISNV